MCDPITIGAMALAAGGSVINGMESSKTQNSMIAARNAATQQELARQKQYQDQATQIFNNTNEKFTPEAQDNSLKTAQAATSTGYTNAAPTTADVGSFTSGTGAPRVVQDAADKKVGDVFTRAGNLNNSLGTLKGWDQNFFGNDINLNNGARRLGTVSDFARTSASVNGLEQNAAYRNAYKPNSGIGDILSFAGNVGSYGSGRGWFNPGTGVKSVAADPTRYMG